MTVTMSRTEPEGAAATGSPAAVAPADMRRPFPGWAITAASVVALLAIWEVFGRQINPLFASYPSAIARAAVTTTADGRLPEAMAASLKPMFTGYLLAVVVAVPVGLLLGRYRVFRSGVGIYVTAGYAMPMVALIPLFILWFGLGYSVKVAVVFVMSIFPIIINTAAGARAVPKPLIDVGRSFMASEWELMRKIVVPSTVPYIMTGLRLGVGRAVIGIVVAEFFTALGGLGGMIVDAGTRFDTATLFVPVLVLMLLGVVLTAAIEWLEHRAAPWATAGSDD